MYLDKHKIKIHTSLNKKLGDGEDEIIDLLVSHDKDILESILDSQDADELGEALEDLTGRQKQIITLFYIERIPMTEIASKLGISYRTVVNTKTNALKKLKQGLF